MTNDRPQDAAADGTETESRRVEQGKAPREDPRDRMGDVPLAFGQGGVLLGHGTETPMPAGGDSDAAADVAAARERQGADDDDGTGRGR
jgi:hypothetical protein